MLFTIAAFEFAQQLRRIPTYVYFLIFGGLSFLSVLAMGGGVFGIIFVIGPGGKVLVNSPYALQSTIAFSSFLGVTVTASLAGQATFQDVNSRCTEFFFSAPITKFAYLGGRFLGSLAIQMVIFTSVGLGAWIGTRWPTIDPTFVGPQILAAYIQPYFTLVLPNLVLFTAIFFSVAALGKRMLPVYAGAVILLLGYNVAAQLQNNLTISRFAALIDPLGSNAVDRLTLYWTPFERNTRMIPFAGIVLLNRVLWLGLGVLFLAVTYAKFSFVYSAHAAGRRKRLRRESAQEITSTSRALPAVHQVFSARQSFWQLLSLTHIQFTETLRNVFFIVLMLAGGLCSAFLDAGLANPGATPTYPVTNQMLEMGSAGFFIFVLAIITFYAGELVWRERDAGVNQIIDALPVQRWVLFTSKLVSLMLLQVLVVLSIMAAGLIVQISYGYHRFEFAHYFTELFGVRLVQYWTLCTLALLVHTIINNKYLGHFVMVLYFVAITYTPFAGWQNNLYRFGEAPSYIYSDMNGYGPFAASLFWYRVYWAIAAVALAVLTNLLWVRTAESHWRVRLGLVTSRLSRPAMAGLAACAVLFVATGSYIFYNTKILNRYATTWRVDEDRAQYEKKYRQYKDLVQPHITDINVQMDLDPGRRVFDLGGTMMLENKTSGDISRIAVTVWPTDLDPLPRRHIQVNKLALAGGQAPVVHDDDLGFYLYELASPLPPHGRIALDFSLEFKNIGFVNSSPNTDIVHNGSFLNTAYGPFVGYDTDVELIDDRIRHRHGLDNARRLPSLDDMAARNVNSGEADTDWVNFEGTVSTSPDQIAIIPGYLQKEWMENGRRHFFYKTDGPVLLPASMNSGRYALRRDRWRNVNLEVYYHPGHEFDLDRMMDGMKSALEYCSSNFGPFQFHQERIIEFPRYANFAESFPGTIPYSEDIGFISYVDPKDPGAFDTPFSVTAHEVAHEWWGNQVTPAKVEGETSITETLADYTALMVVKHRYGPEMVQKSLSRSMAIYLMGRGQERNEEPPLYRVQEKQGYIHYSKGSLVMYALQDYIGEENVNRALADFVKAFAFKGPPYAVSLDLIAYLKKYTPREYQYLYDDMWENVTLYNNRARSATYIQQPDGRYQVDLVVEANKVRADANGQEHPIPIHDWIDIAVLDAQGKYLYLQKQMIDRERTELTLTVDKPPAEAGIDPLNKLIDRDRSDHVIAVLKK